MYKVLGLLGLVIIFMVVMWFVTSVVGVIHTGYGMEAVSGMLILPDVIIDLDQDMKVNVYDDGMVVIGCSYSVESGDTIVVKDGKIHIVKYVSVSYVDGIITSVFGWLPGFKIVKDGEE